PLSVWCYIVPWQLPVGLGDGRDDRGTGGGPIVGLADVERDRGALALDEQPGRVTEQVGDAGREALGGLEARFVAGTERRHDPGRATTARVRAVLQPVVTQVGQ